MLADLRFVLRTLIRNRGFTLVIVLTLALGIGSAAAIFGVTDWILFRAPKYSASLYMIGGKSQGDALLPIRFDFMARAYQEQTQVMSAYAKAAYQAGNVVIQGQPVGTGWMGVSANLFPLLGIKPALGRPFLPGEDVAGADDAVIVSYRFWKQHLGGKEEALGRRITTGDRICTLVGVLAEEQLVPAYFNNDVYRPLVYQVNPDQPWLPEMFLLGELRPGLTREQGERELAEAKPAIPSMMRDYLARDRPVLSSMAEVNRTFRAEMYWAILGAVGFLYAIACLNASNLMLVRMLGQQREFSIRLALGGDRWRVVRLLLVESVTLAVLGSLAGALVANWVFPLLMSVAGGASPGTWTMNWRVVGVMALLTVTTSGLIVLAPALRILRADIYSGLKDGGATLGESPALARLRGLFVTLQAGLAMILLAGAGLMIQTFQNFRQVDLGFDPSRKAKIHLSFPGDYPAGNEERLARLREIEGELRRVPGVKAAGFGSDLLLANFYAGTNDVEGKDAQPLRVATLNLGVGYQDASGLKLKAGAWPDHDSGGNAVMVSEAVAQACWPGQNAVGQFLRPVGSNSENKGWQVVAVVGDIRTTLRGQAGLYVYGPEGWGPQTMNTFVVSLSRNYDEALAGGIRQALYRFDPRIVVTQIASLTEYQDDQLWAEKLADSVLKVLAGIALLLTVVGVFSVLAYTVDRRMGEFGIRQALGATPGDLMRIVMRRGIVLSLAGIVIGLSCALALTRYLQSLLFGISAQDTVVLGAAGGLLLLAAILACVLPARRATKVDIAKLLRSQ